MGRPSGRGAAGWLRALVAARATFLVTGGTGSGKTSVLGALLGLVPARERIVVVEDTCELAPDHPHVVSLEARAPNVEGAAQDALEAYAAAERSSGFDPRAGWAGNRA